MSRYRLGINTCFAVKRWPEPECWSEVVRDRLGLDLVQHSLDLVDLDAPQPLVDRQAAALRSACERAGLALDSTFTGLAAYSSNLLLHPDAGLRERAEGWYRKVIDFTAAAGARATGGHVGAYSKADWHDPVRREALAEELRAALGRLAAAARFSGLEELYVENLAAAREPSTMEGVLQLLTGGDGEHVPVVLCLDIGHQCAPGTQGPDRDPYAWLERLGRRAPVVQLQQSDAAGDHHWPFTPERNAQGRIDADRVLAALDASGACGTALLLEVIPPFEQADDEVVEELQESVAYWREALARRDSRANSPVAGRPTGGIVRNTG
jgi:D-erythrulose 1-phosphate 3-epimerase